jgi:CHAT domain-containing protein
MANQKLQNEGAHTPVGGDSISAGIEITVEQIESLSKEVDFYIRSDAQEAFRRAEAAYQLSLHLADPMARALGLRTKARATQTLGRYAEATENYEQARQIYQSAGKDVEAARVSRALVDSLMYQGKYEQALALASEAREVFEAHGETLQAAQLETNVGNIHHRQDRYQESLACYERARAVFAAVDDKTALATVAYNTANIHCNLDDFRQAHSLYRQSQELFQARGMELSAAQSRYAFGYLHFLIGEFHQAVRVLSEVRRDLSRLGKRTWVALCDLDLAEIYLQLNVLDEAAALAEQARQQFQALEMRYEAAKALTLLGLAELRREKFPEAGQLLQQAQDEFASEGNEVHLGLINLYLADLAMKRNQASIARDLALEAERTFSRQNLKARTYYAQMVSARALLLGGEAKKARELVETVIESSRSLEAPWLEYQAHELLGDLFLEEADLTRAHEEYSQAVASVERLRGGIRVDEYRSAFFKDKLRVYEKLIRLCLNHEDASRQAEAFYYLESCKARTLVDLLVNQLETIPANAAGIPADLLSRWRQMREELNWFYNKTSQHEPATDIRRWTVSPKVWEEIGARERALAEVVREIQIYDPHFVSLTGVAGVKVKELCEALAEDEAVIEYYLDDEGVKMFVVDQSGLRIVRSLCERRLLKELVMKLKLQIDKFQYGAVYIATHTESLQSSINGCLRELHRLLFAPVAPLVQGKKLIFIPYDLLHGIPFQALFDGEAYLLEKHEVTYAPSARLLTLFTAQEPQRFDNALIFGAADEYTPLIAEEIGAIHALYPDARCFTGAEATAEALAEHARGKGILHIASHAVFRSDNPMFSAFSLADSWLNFYDICSLDLGAALVTLSGCSTGTNQIYEGDELLGLARGFLSAGASALVVSLWEVNDSVTAKLMAVFYENLQAGLSSRTALRAAELEIKREHPHPYYWAPFVFIGGARQSDSVPRSANSPIHPVHHGGDK